MHIIRTASLAATVALGLAAAPAQAIGPSDRNATATARIVKPLTLNWVQDLDLGTIVLGGGTFTGAAVGISRTGVFTCTNTNVTCSGVTREARYRVTGTNNQTVQVTAPNVTLTNQNDATKTLLLTVDSPGSVNLSNSGSVGLTFGLGGSITVDSTTADGTYTGTFNVTVNY